MLRKDIVQAPRTADEKEIERFNALADEWWKPHGRFKVVHDFNQARLDVIVSSLKPPGGPRSTRVLEGLHIADIGCGGGLVAEALASAGARVTAIDASWRNIAVAKKHVAGTTLEIDYRCALPEELVSLGASFDAVVSLEVLEHVADIEQFTRSLADLVRPGGTLIVGTLNRTAISWILAIVVAENILHWLPRGTHDWNKFVKPKETRRRLCPLDFSEVAIRGVVFNPLVWRWQPSTSTNVNYLHIFNRT